VSDFFSFLRDWDIYKAIPSESMALWKILPPAGFSACFLPEDREVEILLSIRASVAPSRMSQILVTRALLVMVSP